MDLGLGGRGYLVTGASRGLGFAAAQALVVDGARVLVNSRSADAVDAAVASLGGPPAAHGLAADLTDADAADRLVEAARSCLGRVDGVLVSVGGPEPGTVLDTTEDAWRNGVESLLLGPLRLVRALVPHLGEGAAIGLVLSTSARSPLPGPAVSNGLRPGLAMTAKQAGRRAGPARRPGRRSAAGHLRHRAGRRARGRLRRPGAGPRPRGGRHPAAAGGRPRGVRPGGRLPALPAASYVTGTTVAVDGGRLRTP